LTSNIGSKVIEGGGGLGFRMQKIKLITSTQTSPLVNEELKQYFRPEFLNRLDEIIFRQLTG